MTRLPQLTARAVDLDTPNDRPLVRNLNLDMRGGQRVALVGRNGTGKSSLLHVLAGLTEPQHGRVWCTGARHLVPQLTADIGLSPGQQRRQLLQAAFEQAPAFLMLDEPSVDLDDGAATWLEGALQRYDGACLMVSHDRRLLRLFHDFFVVSESGCHHHTGSYESLLEHLAARQSHEEQRYASKLAEHAEREEHHVRIARRRERKKNLGRVHELKRCPARAQLNGKRGYAQVYQAKRNKLQQDRIAAARDWVTSVRRALAVTLPLNLDFPEQLVASLEPIIDGPSSGPAGHSGDGLRSNVRIRHERWAIVGPNGSGKSTLLRALIGEGCAVPRHRVDAVRLGYIAQNASNWLTQASLLEQLCPTAGDLSRAAATIAAHGFPLALAERSLDTLSPGERVRAALIALSARNPAVELLVLDEPTNHLDLLATAQLETLLQAWPGGLLVVSHDHEFLRAIGTEHWLRRDGEAWQLADPGGEESRSMIPVSSIR